MTRTEHLLVIMAEECAEIAQRVTKALRFGLDEIQPDVPAVATNAHRIIEEYADFIAVFEMLHSEDALPLPSNIDEMIKDKKVKIERFLKYSKQCGTLTVK